MRKTALAAALCSVVLGLAAPARAQATVRIKLGTLAPQGSTWHQLLQEMGQKWAQESGGKVELKIFAGGQHGNEGEMMRKVSIGQLQAASITAVGMSEITSEPMAEDVPLMIESYEEYEYVHSRVRAELEQAIAKKGYVVINWGEAGFVYFFSTQPYKSPEEMSKGKVFAWNGDPASEMAWKAGGFHPVVLSSIDLIPSLSAKMIDIINEPPLYAMGAHLYEKANYMLNLRWALLTGATVVRKDVWEKIPADLRPKLLAIAEEVGKRTTEDVRKQNEQAIAQMKKHGLQVVEPTDRAAWKATAERVDAAARGKVVPAAIYDRVRKLRDEYRAQHASK